MFRPLETDCILKYKPMYNGPDAGGVGNKGGRVMAVYRLMQEPVFARRQQRERRVMAIYRLLQQSVFDPEDTQRMGAAYERALVCLDLKDRNDPLTDIIAKLIIEVARTGEKNPETICDVALDWLNDTDRQAG